jgi:hypothetical protein
MNRPRLPGSGVYCYDCQESIEFGPAEDGGVLFFDPDGGPHDCAASIARRRASGGRRLPGGRPYHLGYPAIPVIEEPRGSVPRPSSDCEAARRARRSPPWQRRAMASKCAAAAT